jgi:hypothetical protein
MKGLAAGTRTADASVSSSAPRTRRLLDWAASEVALWGTRCTSASGGTQISDNELKLICYSSSGQKVIVLGVPGRYAPEHRHIPICRLENHRDRFTDLLRKHFNDGILQDLLADNAGKGKSFRCNRE